MRDLSILQSNFVIEDDLDRYVFTTSVTLGSGPQEIDVIVTPYLGDPDLYVLVGAVVGDQATPERFSYHSERSTGPEGIAIRFTDPQFVNSSCYPPSPICRISIGVYVSVALTAVQ